MISDKLKRYVARHLGMTPDQLSERTLEQAVKAVKRMTPDYYDAVYAAGQIPGNGSRGIEVIEVYEFLTTN